jgi:hypothetical protein
MEPVTILSIFSAVVAAVWTAWTWREQQRAVRQVQRDRAAALYVNPLLLAALQLQRRLGSLLDGRELAFNQPAQDSGQDGSVSSTAIETLWTLAQFCAWAAINMRHGPYTREPKVIELITAISRTIDDRERFGEGAFRFSTAEQESLGQTVLRRVGQSTVQAGESSSALAEFGVVTAVDFERDFRDAQSEKAGLFRSRAFRRVVEVIDRAERVEQLEGHERLTAVQQLLASLLDHLEHLEGFCVHSHEIRGVSPDLSVGPPRILHRTRGRIRLGMPELRTNADFADHLKAVIRAWEGVEDVSINGTTGSVAIRYRTTDPDDEFQAKILASIGKATGWEDDEAPAGVTRRRPQASASRQPDAREEGAGPARRQRSRLR